MDKTVKTRLDHNLRKRLLTAAILIPVVLGVLLFAPLGIIYGLILVVALGLTYEWASFTKAPFARVSSLLLTLVGLGFYHYQGSAVTVACMASVFILVYFPMDKLFALGQVYILTAILVLHDHVPHMDYILWFLIITWANDTFAYFTGRVLGGPKLWVAVSPKKTWSGLIGGVFIGGYLSGLFASSLHLIAAPYLISFILSFAGHAGDLLESAAKRHYDVKDSGHILPGHGGLLDRLDSLLFILIVYGVLRFFL